MNRASPCPSANWGQWRNAVVRKHNQRNTAATKQAELARQLRESKANDTNDETKQ